MRRYFTRRVFAWSGAGAIASALAAAAVASACGEVTCAEDGQCLDANEVDAATDAITSDVTAPALDAAADVALDITPPNCDGSADPRTTPCLLDDAFAYFVAPTGVDGAPGTKSAPMRTITEGVARAGNDNRRLFVCAARYDEAVLVTKRVNIHGGFACPGLADAGAAPWAPVNAQSIVAPTAAGPAIEVRNVSLAMAIHDMRFEGAAGTAASPSSVGAFVSNATDVTFKRVTFVGRAGAPGAIGASGGAPLAAAAAGNPANGPLAGPTLPCACNGVVVGRGGGGGDAGTPPTAGEDGTPSLGASAPRNGAGGTVSASCVDGNGGAHARATDAGLAPPVPTVVGTITATGWQPSAGGNGARGSFAQGGGGASGSAALAGSGGGCLGCGGGGGLGGQGGGASVGLLMFNSGVKVTTSAWITAAGGVGGVGGAGQSGQAGGAGGTGICGGGPGGDGAGGSGAGGGTGGLSIAIGFKGTGPIIDGTVYVQEVIDGGGFDASIGAPGAGGAAGAKGVGTGGGGSPDGLPGTAGRPGLTRMIGVSP